MRRHLTIQVSCLQFTLYFMYVLFCFSDTAIVLTLKEPKAPINMEACMEQKVKCLQRNYSALVERNIFFPTVNSF